MDHNYNFLDIRSYLAPNYSYDAFIKAYRCKLEKGLFPYDFFNSYDKINNTDRKDNSTKTFKDFLEWYNNLDVLPFVEAIEKMKEF